MEHQSKAMQIDVHGLTGSQKHIVLTALSNLGYNVGVRRTIPSVTDVGWYYTDSVATQLVGFDYLQDNPSYGDSVPIYVLDFATNEFVLRDAPVVIKPVDPITTLTVGSIAEPIKDFTYSKEAFNKGQWGAVVSLLGDKHALVQWSHKLTQESYKGDHVNWIVPLSKLKLSARLPKPVVKVGSHVNMCRNVNANVVICGKTVGSNRFETHSAGTVVKIKKYKLGATEVDVAIVETDTDGLHYNVFVDALEVLENV